MASEGDARPPAVVGVDGSDQSVAALRWAVRYGAATGTPVRAVLAWHYPTAAAQPPVGRAPEPVTEEVEGHEVTILNSHVADLDLLSRRVQDTECHNAWLGLIF